MERVVFVLTSHQNLGESGKKTGYYLPEAAHPWKVFHNENIHVEFASPQGGKAPLDPESFENFKDDPVCQEFLQNNQANLDKTLKLSEVDPQGVSAVFFVGGHGPMFDLADNQAAQILIREVYEKGGIIGAVCHGPVAFVNATLSDGTPFVRNRQITCFTNEEEEKVQKTQYVPFLLESALKEKGARFQAQSVFAKNVVVDGRIVTGQNPASAGGVAEAMLKLRRH
eukprot:TRINITY_DN18306_c0_g1_i1.p1 TRINITY_DN18306_c0_g1~~TRINITY_DN18306_c0_g1_i1.p1  ORF type:complete len:226 (-),score=44.74 TRINITY_DN18306_c0_g1_i1:57-734(-)